MHVGRRENQKTQDCELTPGGDDTNNIVLRQSQTEAQRNHKQQYQ